MEYDQLILIFAGIIYEALPFIVLGVIIAGILEEFVPQQAIAKIIPKNRFLAICMGGWLGLIFPMCECGIIVVMRRLIRKGLPLSVCVAYMLAGPIINVVVMLSTYVAFTNRSMFEQPIFVVLLRIGLGYMVAIVAAWVVEKQYRRYGNDLLAPSVTKGLQAAADTEGVVQEKRSWLQRLSNITETALHDFVDILAFLILGAFLAAAGRAVLREANLENAQAPAVQQAKANLPDAKQDPKAPATQQQPPQQEPSKLAVLIRDVPPFSIFLMMFMAVLFCLCSEADAFVAANFQAIWPPASKMAFLILGPMMDIKLYLMYTSVFRPRLIRTIILAVVIQVFLYCVALHYAFQWFS